MKKGIFVLMFSFYGLLLVWAGFTDIQNKKSQEIRLNTGTADSFETTKNSNIPIDALTGLVIAPGYAKVKKNCLGCHSSKLITQNSGPRSMWEGTIRWMQKTQNLWDLGEDEKPILDYLSKHYAPKESGRRKPLSTPEWYELSKH